MLFFVIELDEERIEKDGIINLDDAYKCINDTFAQEDVTLYSKKGATRLYTRETLINSFIYILRCAN